MREFIGEDIVTLSRIADKMQLKPDVDGKTQQQIGAEFLIQIFGKLHLADKEVWKLVADLHGLKAEDVSKMPVRELKPLIRGIVTSADFADFFK